MTVHPHAGGENVILGCAATASWRFTPTRVGKTPAPQLRLEPLLGSPPRGWGKLPLASLTCLADRFTPTRVGKTPRA